MLPLPIDARLQRKGVSEPSAKGPPPSSRVVAPEGSPRSSLPSGTLASVTRWPKLYPTVFRLGLPASPSKEESVLGALTLLPDVFAIPNFSQGEKASWKSKVKGDGSPHGSLWIRSSPPSPPTLTEGLLSPYDGLATSLPRAS